MRENMQTERSKSSTPFSSSRRAFSLRLAALFPAVGFAGRTFARPTSPFSDDDGITHSAEAIHQEVTFAAPPARVYDALTDARQFSKVVQLSAAAQTMSISSKPAEISREAGGAFSAFGGYVTGRQIELVPGQRIVQVWRAGGWDPGAYSIAHFELTAAGAGTKLIFDHTGFPQGQADHLAAGWKGNYWEPLTKFLAAAK